jgi:hypothetical protein
LYNFAFYLLSFIFLSKGKVIMSLSNSITARRVLIGSVVLLVLLAAMSGGSIALANATAEPQEAAQDRWTYPATPIHAELSIDELPPLGEPATLTCEVSSALAAPGTTAQIELPAGAHLVDGDLSWEGNLRAGRSISFKATVTFNAAGDAAVFCRALRPIDANNSWGDLAALYLSVGRGETESGFAPVGPAERAALGEVDEPGDGVTIEASSRQPMPALEGQPAEAPPSVDPSSDGGGPAAPGEDANPGSLTITGRWRFHDRDDVKRSEQMLVEIVNGDDFSHLAWCYTDVDGYYSCGPFTNPGSDGVVSLWYSYVKFSGNRLLTVNPDWGTDASPYNAYYVMTHPAMTFSDGTQDIGSWYINNDNYYERAFWITDDLIREYKYIWFNAGKSQSPQETAGPGTVEWKIDSTDGTYYRRGENIHLEGEDPLSNTVVGHEYGHNIMWTIYGDWMPTTHCPSPHYIQYSSHVNCAWTEGWANFITIAANNDPVYRWASGSSLNLENPTWGTPYWHEGEDVEGRVAGAMWDIIDTHDDGYDQYDGSFADIWDTIYHQNDNRFSEYWAAWKSRGHNEPDAVMSIYQNTIDYRTAPPRPTTRSPRGTITTNRPTYTWNESSGATRYQLRVAGPSGRIINAWYDVGDEVTCTSSGRCSVRPTVTLVHRADYTWRVRARNDFGTSAWSASRSFDVNLAPPAPTLRSPHGTITSDRPPYRWEQVRGARRYQLRVAGPTGRVINAWFRVGTDVTCSGGICQVRPDVHLADGNYTWRVRVRNQYRGGPWSRSMSFTVR